MPKADQGLGPEPFQVKQCGFSPRLELFTPSCGVLGESLHLCACLLICGVEILMSALKKLLVK